MHRLALAFLALAQMVASARPAADEPATAYVNGRWFDGRRFVNETVYVVAGRLSRTPPAAVQATVDLAGQFVVPPFAEAHNHRAASAEEDLSERFLDAGVFYVKDPNNLPRERERAAQSLGRPDTIDASFANGGFTAPGGHPLEVVTRAIARGDWTAADGEGAFVHTLGSEAELARKWPGYLATRPDFVKIYLLYSEQYARRRDDPLFEGRRGLDPALVPAIVARAHDAGLRVTAHVESAADFHVAVASGVDEVAHLPGFRGPDDESLDLDSAFAIAESDARLAAARGTIVVTTIGGAAELAPDGPLGAMRRRADALHARNLGLLAAHGVRLAIGSDAYDDTSVREALYVHGLRVLDSATLLRIWCRDTAQAIFPGRAIGRLDDGAEASFVVLAGDPLEDFANVRRVTSTVKSGILRQPSATPPPSPPAAVAPAVRVSVTYAGRGRVDREHPLLVFAFDHEAIGADSVPLAFQALDANGGTVTFDGLAADPLYFAAVFDPRGRYAGNTGPPPPGTPIGYHLVPGTSRPAPVRPGERVAIRFDDSTRFQR